MDNFDVIEISSTSSDENVEKTGILYQYFYLHAVKILNSMSINNDDLL